MDQLCLGKGIKSNPKAVVYELNGAEDSLHRRKAREGTWSIIRGTETDPNAIVYRLAPSKAEGALLLLKGDENVLFFLNQHGKPLAGNAEFGYTLHRRAALRAHLRADRRAHSAAFSKWAVAADGKGQG